MKHFYSIWPYDHNLKSKFVENLDIEIESTLDYTAVVVGRSTAEVHTKSTQLVWLNRLTNAQPSHSTQ